MPKKEVVVGIGGAAGDGQATAGDALARTCARLGLHAYSYNSYQSVIRGGHIWLRIRFSDQKVLSHGDQLNVLIALNQDALDRHTDEVAPGGAVIFNADRFHLPEKKVAEDVRVLPLPCFELANQYGFADALRRLSIMQNTVALGACAHLLGLDFDVYESLLQETYKHKGEGVVRENVQAARAGHEYARKNVRDLGLDFTFTRKRRAFITGNEAFSFGSVAAGAKFYSAYPMTPASSILQWMAKYGPGLGVCVKQAEDELAVVNMTIGANHAGARAWCATSGGGFALMTEAIGQAGMIETPVVVMNVMRAGPSTGVPTKTEQADLNQVLGASQGDFPRFIIAPRNLVECFTTMPEAFNLADKYQCPVLLISDLLLSESNETVDPELLDFNVPIERGEIWQGSPVERDGYKRYLFTETGISPRALPGTPGGVHVAGSDEHDEHGILISDVFTNPVIRKKMMEKRMRKLELGAKELPPPRLSGPEKADVTLVGWGSTEGVIHEAMELLAAKGIAANNLQIKYIHPFHGEEVLEILGKAKKTLVVENNYTGQFYRHISAETGYRADGKILKYDGEPFEPRQVADAVKKALRGTREVRVGNPR